MKMQTYVRYMNTELISSKMQLQYVEKYKSADAFVRLSDSDTHYLINRLASLVYMDDADGHAKRFDNLMYGMMIARIEGLPQFNSLAERECFGLREGVCATAQSDQVYG